MGWRRNSQQQLQLSRGVISKPCRCFNAASQTQAVRGNLKCEHWIFEDINILSISL